MRKIFTILFLGVLFVPVSGVFGQQDPQYTQYMFSKLATNPGYAGNNDAICGTLLYRNQWTGFGEEPKTMLFSLDMPVRALHGGLGLNVTAQDKLGFQKDMYANLSYAYRMTLGRGKLGIGASIGIIQKEVDGTKFIYYHANDPNIPTTKVSGSSMDVGLGAYYQDDDLYVGLSSTHLIEGEIKYDNIVSPIARHYYLTAGYNYEINPDLMLKPSVLVKSDGATQQFDINANVLIKNRFWGGVGYRLDDAIVIMAGIEIIPNLKFGYSYDMTTSDIKTYSSGTHEIMLGYCFKPVAKPPKRQFHRNVRFL
jgi:type IX secretion system PorP/SprF family membrane protein